MFREHEVGAPLRQSQFRRVWGANLLSNFGSLIQGVGIIMLAELMEPCSIP